MAEKHITTQILGSNLALGNCKRLINKAVSHKRRPLTKEAERSRKMTRTYRGMSCRCRTHP